LFALRQSAGEIPVILLTIFCYKKLLSSFLKTTPYPLLPTPYSLHPKIFCLKFREQLQSVKAYRLKSRQANVNVN
jgi:hypothetical protein